MTFASPLWKVPMCNKKCEPILRCPNGYHVSKSHKSCVWNGKKKPKSDSDSDFDSYYEDTHNVQKIIRKRRVKKVLVSLPSPDHVAKSVGNLQTDAWVGILPNSSSIRQEFIPYTGTRKI